LEGINMIVTNARTGHVAMFLRNPDNRTQLYVVENQPPLVKNKIFFKINEFSNSKW
jgi:hypothetical protein